MAEVQSVVVDNDSSMCKAGFSSDDALRSVMVNSRIYNKPQPGQTYVGMCFDGTNIDYINQAIDAGFMPNLKRIINPPDFSSFQESYMKGKTALGESGNKVNFFQAQGHMGIAAGAFPTYTNPNNVSIITGVSPLEHGICGNYYYDSEKNQTVTMTSPSLIRSDSILAKLYESDPIQTRITVITSKDKLKNLLLHQLPQNYEGSELPTTHQVPTFQAPTPCGEVNHNVRALSVEALHLHPDLGEKYTSLVSTYLPSAPTKAPNIYDPANSSYALQLGYALFKRDQADGFNGANIFYLSTTDYVQHKYGPGTGPANNLLAQFDDIIGAFHDDGAIIGFTADHGMNDKSKFGGEPNVVYLSDELDAMGLPHRTILPITDPYIAHHGALGGYATIYIDEPDQSKKDAAITAVFTRLRQLPGCYSVMGRSDAVRGLDLPPDRIGDIVVLGDKQSVFGTRTTEHDLSKLHGERLRSHGSLEESFVPLMYNRPLDPLSAKDFGKGRVRNYDLFNHMFNTLQ